MDWEAIFIIGGGAVVLGLVLLLPGLMWARRKVRTNPDTPFTAKLNRSGYLGAAIGTFFVFGGFSAQFWASDTTFGKWISTDVGLFVYLVIVVAVSVIVERGLYHFIVRTRAYQNKANDV